MSDNPGSNENEPGHRPGRRRLLLAGTVALVGGGLAASHWFNIWASTGEGRLSVEDAHSAALRGELLLVDIRRPEEWRATGIGEGAHPLDMRRDDFTEALAALGAGDRSRKIALICARGVRSRQMAARLMAAGFSDVSDVPEGMLGSGAGPGWIRRGLPMREGG